MLPDTVNGLPLHALAIHATVVLVPLLALLGIMYAVPGLRGWARWPLGLVAVGAAVSTWVSLQSGHVLEEALEARGSVTGPWADAIQRHEELADQLQWMVYAYAVIALIAIFAVRPSGPAEARDAAVRDSPSVASSRGATAIAVVMSVLLVLGAVATGVQVARVGDAGAKAVWNPDGNADYSTD